MGASKANTRPLLSDSIADAETPVGKLNNPETQFTERDKAAEAVAQYRGKLAALNEEQAKELKKSVQDRIEIVGVG